ncbi:MAG TPA: hypothetical protein VG477_09525, partial [Thermoanaerobaculia bacterium]|nr:hypothetical protein [Thermoanaerobaculia bacterium]
MDRKFAAGVLTVVLAAALLGSAALGESPRTSRMDGWASPRVLLASADLESVKLEPLKTLDKTEVYQLSIALREGEKLLPGMEVEYEVHAIDGAAVGGGLFSVTQEMLASGGNSLSVLTGLGGLNLSSRHLLIFKL